LVLAGALSWFRPCWATLEANLAVVEAPGTFYWTPGTIFRLGHTRCKLAPANVVNCSSATSYVVPAMDLYCGTRGGSHTDARAKQQTTKIHTTSSCMVQQTLACWANDSFDHGAELPKLDTSKE